MRPKPAIAEVNREIALANIRSKKSFLAMASHEMSSTRPRAAELVALLSRLVKTLPTSSRQFNAWTSETFAGWGKEDWPSFKRNAQKTLVESGELEIVRKAIAAVQVSRSLLFAAPDQAKQERIASFKRRLREKAMLLEISEEGLQAALISCANLKKSNAALESQIVSLTRAFQEKIRVKEEQIASLRKAEPANVIVVAIKNGKK